jgi:hypothetical protein
MNGDLEAALDEALAERLDRFYGDVVVARTMRTPKEFDRATAAAVQRAVQVIKRLFRDGPPERSSPFKRKRRGLGLLHGAVGDCGAGVGQGGPSTEPDLRLVE